MLLSLQSRIKKGSGSLLPSSANASPLTTSHIGDQLVSLSLSTSSLCFLSKLILNYVVGGGKDGMSKSSESDVSPLSTSGNAPYSDNDGSQKVTPPNLPETEKASASFSKMEGTMDASSISLPEGESTTSPNAVAADQGQKVLAAPHLYHDNPVVESKKLDYTE